MGPRAGAGWPPPAVRQAVAAVLADPEAALVASWLTADDDAPAPPLRPDALAAILARLRAARH